MPGQMNKHLQQHLRLLDLKTLQAADFSGKHFVHVEIVVDLQLILPNTEGRKGTKDSINPTSDIKKDVNLLDNREDKNPQMFLKHT